MSLIIELINDGTGTSEVSNYDYAVSINGKILDTGKIRNHIRNRGWEVLVWHLATEVNKNKITQEVQDAQKDDSPSQDQQTS